MITIFIAIAVPAFVSCFENTPKEKIETFYGLLLGQAIGFLTIFLWEYLLY
jgi:hypothetical protein